MARRKVVERNYPELINEAEEKIEALSAELKQEKVRYDAMVEKQRKQDEIQKAAELLMASGKSMEEIEEFLSN